MLTSYKWMCMSVKMEIFVRPYLIAHNSSAVLINGFTKKTYIHLKNCKVALTVQRKAWLVWLVGGKQLNRLLSVDSIDTPARL